MSSVHEVLSRHAAERAQQRGVSPAVLDLLIHFGKPFPAGDGCQRLQLDRRGTKRARRYVGSQGAQLVDRARGLSVILGSDGSVVTVQHSTSRVLEKYRPWRAA